MSDFMIKNFYKQRKDFEKSSAERNLTLTFPDTVTEIKNIPYMTDGSAAKDNTSLDTDFPRKAVNHTSRFTPSGLLPPEKTGRRTSPGNCKCAWRRTFTWQQRI